MPRNPRQMKLFIAKSVKREAITKTPKPTSFTVFREEMKSKLNSEGIDKKEMNNIIKEKWSKLDLNKQNEYKNMAREKKRKLIEENENKPLIKKEEIERENSPPHSPNKKLKNDN